MFSDHPNQSKKTSTIHTRFLKALDVLSKLIVAVEQEFDVSFTSSEISKLENVGQFAALIQQKLGA